MTRDEKISALIDADLTTDGWGNIEDTFAWMAHILREGFVGYGRYTDAELDQELAERGLVESVESL